MLDSMSLKLNARQNISFTPVKGKQKMYQCGDQKVYHLK